MVLYHIDFSRSGQHLIPSLTSRSTQTMDKSQVASQKQDLPGFRQSSMDRKRPLQSLDRITSDAVRIFLLQIEAWSPSIDLVYKINATPNTILCRCAQVLPVTESKWIYLRWDGQQKEESFQRFERWETKRECSSSFRHRAGGNKEGWGSEIFFALPAGLSEHNETMWISTSWTPKRVTEDAESVQTMTLENGPSMQKGVRKRVIGY